MRTRFCKGVFVTGLSVAGLLLLPFTANASCTQPVTAPLQAQVDAIKANVKAFLGANPSGGGAMVRDVRNVVAADIGLAKTLAEAARTGAPEQKSAIGAGLGQAARICERVNPQAANQIQQAVASASDLALAAEFLNVTGPTATAATGATGSASGSAPAGGPVGTGSPSGGATLNGGGRVNAGSFPGSVSSNVSLTRTGGTGDGGLTINNFNISPSIP
jgi:hypothetical protein